jgi:two-component system, chemotaxis family, chemotaxis protein CheY
MAQVLIVDDDETDRLFQRSILEQAGHSLFFAKNGEEAVRLYLRNSIDVVVTDLHMPRGDGFEVITALLGLDPDACIIAVSGTGPEQLSMAKMLGAQAIMEKPVSPGELLEAVARACS